ncbi:hypothetical protein [uncultured Prevotella sp.]|uniref:hypothetical protein n=1 Tax=uncultured Prevotella sp. TaxID=159272 RepID=UPI0025CBE701|nr:hypothetical protein [uncultured Prevotella sp.]
MDIKDLKKNAMRDALDKVYSWKSEHTEEYSRFFLDMMKIMRNDFSQIERIFKMAAKYVPISVLIECQKLLVSNTDTVLSDDEKTAMAIRVVDEMMAFTGYLRLGFYSDVVGEDKDETNEDLFLIREYCLVDKDMSAEDAEHLYIPNVSAKEFWDSLPSLVQMAVFNFSKGHTAEELATISKRIMLSVIHALPEMFFKLRDEIFEGRNTLLMCTLFYICFDHGLPKSAMALSKVSLNDKQLSIVRESVKTIIVNLVETSVTQGLDKKAEWTKQSKDIEDIEFRQTIKNALANTKGKHGRRTILQEELCIDDILIAENKTALKETILVALNNMEHEYETAYIKAALLRTNHLDSKTSFATFLRAVNHFSGREYKYDPAQRVDSFITINHKKFAVSSSSKWQRARRIVSGFVERFEKIE